MIEHNRLVSLVQKSQQGNDAALNELMNECYEGFYYFALKSTGDAEKALEATQDGCVEILSTLKNLREPAAFITWSQRIIYHQCIRHQKKSVEVQAEEDEDGFTIFDRVADEDATAMPEEVYEDKEFQQTIRDLLDSLPAEQCSALMLYYYEKRSVKEIADIQGTTEGTIKSRLNYGRKAVKKKVEDYEERTGLRLHGAMPLLLFRLFSSEASAMSAIPTLSVISGGALVGAGTTAAGATTVSATAAGASFATKIIVSLIAAATIIGGAVGTVALLGDDSAESSRIEEVQKDPSDANQNGGANNNGGASQNGNNSNSDHQHQYTFTGEKDYNYHQFSCTCGETKQEVHSYQDNECTVCKKYIPFSYEANTADGTCTIESYRESNALIVIPSTIDGCEVTTIAENAFRKNSTVQEIILPDTVREIRTDAFSQCSALTKIHIPASVTTFGETVFILSDNLEEVTYAGTVKEWEALNVDRDYVFLFVEAVHCSDGDFSYLFGYEINEDGNSCTIVEDNFGKEKTVIPAVFNGHPVTQIGNGDEPLCMYLGECPIREVVIPDGVVSINDKAFQNFTLLTKVNIPESVTSIGSAAFANTAITEITLPKSLAFVAENAFSECSALETVVYEGTVAEWQALGVDLNVMLSDTPSLCLQCSDGELIWGYTYEVNEDGETCTITEILRNDNHLALPSAIDGYRVTRLGNGNIELISRWALNLCESVRIPEGVLEIDNAAFYGFEDLTQIQLPSTLLRIGNEAFSGCENLTEIALPDGLTEIGANAFSYCGLTKVVLPDSVTTLGNQAFYECSDLKEIVLSRQITQIGTATLQYCTSLEKLTVPGVLTDIGDNSMRGCRSLTGIEFGGTVDQWNAIAFGDYWDIDIGSYTVYCTDGTITR